MNLIECIGGPIDGEVIQWEEVPADGHEITQDRHSYTFDLTEWQFTYRGRWRHIEIGNALLTYRTYGEALRQLGQLQFTGAISAAESLEIQAVEYRPEYGWTTKATGRYQSVCLEMR